MQKTTVDTLLADLKAHYETTGQRTLREAETRLTPLTRFFTNRRASAISGDVLTAYIQYRQAAGLSNGTINREISVLGTAYKLGLEHGKVVRRPVIHLLKEARPRQGFFEEHQFLGVRKHLSEDLQVAVTIMWLYGWRRSEVMALQQSQDRPRSRHLAAGTWHDKKPRGPGRVNDARIEDARFSADPAG